MHPIVRIALTIIAIGALAGTVAVADGLLDRDAQRLERARDNHLAEVERAFEVYANRVERANTTLTRIYEPLIKQYEARGDSATAQALKHELEVLIGESLTIAFPTEGLGDSKAPDPGAHAALINLIGRDVVNANGQRALTAGLERYDYAVLYFTAGWCAPCRSFTPQFVRFYEENKGLGNWEVIVVSSDRSENAFYEYLRGAGMPWAAVPYERLAEAQLNQRFGVSGIPRVVVLDKTGKTLLSRTGGPSIFNDLSAILQKQ